MNNEEEPPIGSKLIKAVVEGVVTAFAFGTAVIVIGSLLGMRDALAGPYTSWIIAGCGATGLFLSGRLSIGAFDDR